MHIEGHYGIVEVMEEGRIIATPLFKRAFPLLRYDTNDFARIMNASCPCRRTSMKLHSIRGREGDILIGKDGMTFDTYTVFSSINVPQGHMKECKFIQSKNGNVTAYIVLSNKGSEKLVRKKIMVGLQDNFPIAVKFVRAFPRSKQGQDQAKSRLIESHVRTKYLNRYGYSLDTRMRIKKSSSKRS